METLTNKISNVNYSDNINFWYQGLKNIDLYDIINFNKDYFNSEYNFNKNNTNELENKKNSKEILYLNELALYIIQNMKLYIKNENKKYYTGMDKILNSVLESKENIEYKQKKSA